MILNESIFFFIKDVVNVMPLSHWGKHEIYLEISKKAIGKNGTGKNINVLVSIFYRAKPPTNWHRKNVIRVSEIVSYFGYRILIQ